MISDYALFYLYDGSLRPRKGIDGERRSAPKKLLARSEICISDKKILSATLHHAQVAKLGKEALFQFFVLLCILILLCFSPFKLRELRAGQVSLRALVSVVLLHVSPPHLHLIRLLYFSDARCVFNAARRKQIIFSQSLGCCFVCCFSFGLRCGLGQKTH